jgi:hypothetical protein
MSGGSFDYTYHKINDFYFTLESYLKDPEQKIPEDIRIILAKVVTEAKVMSDKMKAIEWYFSGDDGDDTFREHAIKWGEDTVSLLRCNPFQRVWYEAEIGDIIYLEGWDLDCVKTGNLKIDEETIRKTSCTVGKDIMLTKEKWGYHASNNNKS